MPPTEWHLRSSLNRTGQDHRQLHEWLDGDPQEKSNRHDITKVFEHGGSLEQQYGPEARREYLQHLVDDLKSKLGHAQQDFQAGAAKALADMGIH